MCPSLYNPPSSRLLPKEISKEPFGLLPPKVRSPNKILRVQSRGGPGEVEEDGGGVNCGHFGEGSWGGDFP